MCLPKSDEHKTNISLALSGKNHPNFGKSLSAETCVLISEAMKGIERSEEHKVKISVANDLTIYLYNLDEKTILREKAQEALLFEIKELLYLIKPTNEEEQIKRACLELVTK